VQSQPDGPSNVRLRFLADPALCLWCWEIVSASGRVVESSWEHGLAAFGAPREALDLGLERLLELTRPSRLARAPARPRAEAPAPPATRLLAIVGAGERGLCEWLRQAFASQPHVTVIYDRRQGERRRAASPPATDRRRGDRRARPDVDDQLRATGWTIVAVPPSAA
jgi:hypothetical protein